MATYRQYVIYDQHWAQANRWALVGDIIRIRFRMANGPEYTVDLPLLEARPRALDEDRFVTGPHRVAGVAGQLEFILCATPDAVAGVMRHAGSSR